MRLSLIGAVLLVLLGVVLAVLGITWYREYNTEYALTVGDVLAGEPRGCLGLGPRHKRAVVTGLALRSKAEPVTVQVLNKKGRVLKEWSDVQVGDSLSLDYTELPGSPWEVFKRHKRFRPRRPPVRAPLFTAAP